MRPKTIGILGCGVIGTVLAKYAAKDIASFVKKIILYDMDSLKCKLLADSLPNASAAKDMAALIDKSDLVIEAAAPGVVPDFLKRAIKKEKDVLIMSIGGLIGNENLIELAEKKGIRLILPSGAISGIDGLKASKLAGLKTVTLITRKPPRSLKGAPYLMEKGIDVDTIHEETVIFEDTAERAIKVFPKNINISALLSIAGLGAKKTRVKIVVSPEYEHNIHEIRIESLAGNITIKLENVPSPDNPRTSSLAVFSAIVSLKEYFESVCIGT